ncbi:WD40/YVTN/BNR-like repeat-containing protein [Ekhidna sp.]|uniref:WD40/YVTN/BNR-like repeat-containing protein n=1 Tax=Ekhidna sp. TaxID=2608089 RepID=UPI003CCC2A05
MKYKLLTMLLAFSSVAMAQKLDMEAFENMAPRNIGPAGMSGRVTAIDVVTDEPDVMYVGTASGGVWKSTSGGIDWKPIFNDQTTASIGAVAIQQSNPSVVWVGTGEGNPRNSLNGGDGIYRTLDGGKTWKKMGLEKTRHIHRIIIHPDDPNTIYVGAIGSPWGEHEERGIYKTTDGGKTWDRILFTNIRSGAAELVMDPTNPNKLIAAMWEHKRDPWFFKSGGPGSGLYVTFDGGETWEQRTDEDGLPKGELGRIGLAIAPSRPNVIYALIESKKNALYRSDDGGFNWKKINDNSDIGNRPFYYHEIYVDPINENRVYSIFTYVNVSVDGGKSFNQLMGAYGVDNGVHPDHHAWYIHPKDPNFMMDGNDGGLNITRDRGETWRFVENLPVGQFYHIAVDNETPYNVYGGMQDNGSWAGPAYVWKAQGIRNHYWQEVSFGDGFDVLPDPRNSRYGISTAQQGYASIYDRKTGYNETVRPTYPDGDVELRFNWNVGMARDPQNPSTIYFGSQFVHKSTDGGQNWEIISPDLTTDDPEKQKQGESGGLTMDATGAENYCTVIVIEPSPLNSELLWVGTDDGNVQITRNGGDTWTNVGNRLPGLPKGTWVTQIKASNKNEGEALLVANDYRRFNYTPYAYRTREYGQTWERIVDSNDVVSYTLSIVEDPEESRLLFLGTDDGLYVSIDAGANWTKWDAEGFPTTNAYDLVIHPEEHDLVIGTFGRAIWVMDDIRPLREIAKNGRSTLDKTLNVYDPPVAYVASNQQPKGSRFGGDALYNGENRPYGAMLTYSINRPEEKKEEAEDDKKGKKGKKNQEPDETEKKDEEKVSYDSLTIEIINGDEVIRTLKSKAPKENGIHRTFWYMDEKGVGFMSRRDRRGNREPGGSTVLPGSYKVRFTFGDQKDSTNIEVRYDPRIEMSDAAIRAQYNALKDMESKYDLGIQAVDRLKESIDIAKSIQSDLKEKDKEGYKEQIELCKTTIDTLNSMLDVFLGEEDDRQGITRGTPNSVNNSYFSARRYTSNALHAPGETEQKLIDKFEKDLSEAMDMVNGYYNEKWPEFREAVESLDTSPFKDYEEIKEEE